ncbi:D-alanyl-D-alanine carboxypeptidase family protein [Anaerosacchariphilus polymeriproducens]|uniref:D-alanyl-D-alanine carboxypeptidase n=1 Tax=Anaerosacchariphilus polymeriproducens TaxID=1812858 RepID=A0A371AVH2_9FIRM|nr:D-alanyl-D-alanine carboxypeptidase family protein [Anaerosacchariphilus polymeriproducens]RDU23563.1 D-alanyl-D-alanine carboxypeptidase [Anaerosacchariphilus polymeriproducens]
MKRIYSITAIFISLFLCLNLTINCYASEKKIDNWPSGPNVSSDSAIIMEASTGAILYEKNIDKQQYPASITKIMTTLLAIEKCSMDETVTFSKEAVFGIERNSSHIARDVGEQLTMEQCLYAIMLESANEVSAAVAEHIGGSNEGFAKIMNAKAKELGCKNTHFNNPHGLPDENHYTSAYDMALIAKAAISNNTFKTIIGTKRYTLPQTNKNDECYYLNNHHKMLQEALHYDGCEGGKTGYTTVAGATLVTFAKRGDLELICVVMKTSGTQHYEDTKALFDYAFENFEKYNIAENETNFTNNPQNTTSNSNSIFGDYETFISLNENDCVVLPKSSKFADAIPSLNYNNKDADVLATLSYHYNKHFVGSTTVKLVEKSKKDNFNFDSDSNLKSNKTKSSSLKINIFKILKLVFFFIIIILILLIIIYICNLPKLRRRRRRKYNKRRRHR